MRSPNLLTSCIAESSTCRGQQEAPATNGGTTLDNHRRKPARSMVRGPEDAQTANILHHESSTPLSIASLNRTDSRLVGIREQPNRMPRNQSPLAQHSATPQRIGRSARLRSEWSAFSSCENEALRNGATLLPDQLGGFRSDEDHCLLIFVGDFPFAVISKQACEGCIRSNQDCADCASVQWLAPSR